MTLDRRAVAALLGATSLALPAVDALAAGTVAAARKKVVVTKKLTGDAYQAGRWGDVQVTVTVRVTRTAGSSKTTVRYVDLGGTYSYHSDRSQYIMSRALPILRQEFLQAQSASVQLISGATDTSQAFAGSLQSALLKLKA
jgi:uncharacterized protein with FMN-binding domain